MTWEEARGFAKGEECAGRIVPVSLSFAPGFSKVVITERECRLETRTCCLTWQAHTIQSHMPNS